MRRITMVIYAWLYAVINRMCTNSGFLLNIIAVVKAMQPKMSAGYDNISMETIKLVITYIADC